jgi:hypothetical protein
MYSTELKISWIWGRLRIAGRRAEREWFRTVALAMDC